MIVVEQRRTSDRRRSRSRRSSPAARPASRRATSARGSATHKVLERVSLEMARERGHRADRTVRLRQVDVPADPQSHARARSRRVARRDGALDGIDIYRSELRVTEIRRRIGMVFQKPNPFPTMTVAENVVVGPASSAGVRSSRSETQRDSSRRACDAGRPLERGQEPARRSPAARCRAASSSACASPARSRCGPACC